MDISVTHAKQEVDVIKRIFAQSSYAETLSEINLFLYQFEGKHFRHITTNLLYSRIIEILNKFKRKAVINNYFKDTDTPLISDLQLRVDIENKESGLENYKSELEKYIWKSEMQTQKMRGRLTGLDEDVYSFHYTLPNGVPQTITLYSTRSKSKMTFHLFKVLYEHWLQYGEEVITKSNIINALSKLGEDDVNEQTVEFYIANLKTKLIAPAKLSGFVQIVPAKKEKGYIFKIKYI
jgi:hypothetical protein